MGNWNLAKVLHYAEIIPVFYPRGGFRNRTGTKIFLKAPFSVIKIQGNENVGPEVFCMPNAIGTPEKSWADDNMDYVTEMAREDFGYHTLKNFVMGEHEVGNYAAYPDNWRGFFAIGFV